MALTDTFVKQIKHKGSATGDKYADGGGLYLHVKGSLKGSLKVTTPLRYWRMAYRFDGKQKTLALGTYPEVSLLQARELRDAARKQLAKEPPIDPGAAKKDAKAARAAVRANTFLISIPTPHASQAF